MLLAWLGLAYLNCQGLAIHPKSQILATCKSGRYMSEAIIIQIAQSVHTMIYIPLQVTFSWRSCSGQLALDNSVGNTSIPLLLRLPLSSSFHSFLFPYPPLSSYPPPPYSFPVSCLSSTLSSLPPSVLTLYMFNLAYAKAK